MSLLFFNGIVHTLDNDNSIYDAIVTDGEKIVAVGDGEALVREWQAAEKVDLEGAHVYPGFVDAHAHVYGMGERLTKVRLEGMMSKREVLEKLRGIATGLSTPQPPPPTEVGERGEDGGLGRWIISRGWDHTSWSDNADSTFPSKADLDEHVSTTQPVALTRVDGHALWCNSRALDLAGITRDTPAPLGGAILHDENGEPTGILLDEAMKLVESKIPQPTIDDLVVTLRVGLRYFMKRGHVAVHEMGVSAELWEAYVKLYEREGDSLPRAYVFLDMTKETGKKFFVDNYSTPQPPPPTGGGGVGKGGGRLTMTGIKLYLDGALGSRGAQMFEDYSDDPGNNGLALMEDEEVVELMQMAAKYKLQIAVHAIGDKANARALDLFERAGVVGGGATLRIEHAQIVRDDDVSRFAELGVYALVQPAFFASDRRWAADRLGASRMRSAYRWKSFVDAGVKFVASSDAPIEEPDPIAGIALLMNRDGVDDGEAIALGEAVRSYAQTACELTKEEAESGRLAVGMRADMTILDGALPVATVREVVIGGRIESAPVVR